MMNIQNPSFAQQHFGYHGHAMQQPDAMAHFPADFPQSQFQQPPQFPNTPQQIPQFNQGQVPPHLYQQYQQQQQLHQHQQEQQQQQQQQRHLQQQAGGFVRPQSRDNLAVAQGTRSATKLAKRDANQQQDTPKGNRPTTRSTDHNQQCLMAMLQTPLRDRILRRRNKT